MKGSGTMYKVLCFILSGAMVLSQFGCTSQLWEDTDPNERIWIDATEITEEELQKRGVEYEAYSSENLNGYLLKKSTKDKFKDYHLRLLGTPVTIMTDAAVVAGTVAGVVVYVYLSSMPEGTVIYSGSPL